MASYQARQRDPLFDSVTQATLERRGKELFGFVLLITAALLSLILWSYTPDDPSWLSVTDAPVANFLGRFGASIASPVMVIVGLGGWAIAAILAVWGVRFVAHAGEERAIPRLIFAPIAVAMASVYVSTHVPGAGWTHSFGLGGLFGDTVLGAILGVIPVKATIGLKIMSLVMAAALLVMAAIVLGLTKLELRQIARFLLFGVIMVYVGLMRVLGLGARGTWAATRKIQVHRAERKEQKQVAKQERRAAKATADQMLLQPVVRRAPQPGGQLRAQPAPVENPPQIDTAPENSGLLSRLPSFLKRTPESPQADPQLYTADEFGDPQIKAKIAHGGSGSHKGRTT